MSFVLSLSSNLIPYLVRFSSVLFAAVGTCGQRCTSLRRLLVHESQYEIFKSKLIQLYDGINDVDYSRKTLGAA